MAVAALIVSVVALLVAGASAWYARTEARAAASADHRARRPSLTVTLTEKVSEGTTTALYYVENRGLEDLDSVIVFRPVTGDGVNYDVAKLGGTGFDESADLGPLEIKEKQGFVLSIGSAEFLPPFRVRIRATIGKDTWEDAHVLDDPRFHLGIY